MSLPSISDVQQDKVTPRLGVQGHDQLCHDNTVSGKQLCSLPTFSPISPDHSSGVRTATVTNRLSTAPTSSLEVQHDADEIEDQHSPQSARNWMLKRLTMQQINNAFKEVGSSSSFAVPEIVNENCKSIHLPKMNKDLSKRSASIKGSPRLGPGPPIGKKRTSAISALEAPVMFALLHLVKEGLHVYQTYDCNTAVGLSSQMMTLADNMAALAELDAQVSVSQAMKKKIWSLTPQLGVPSFMTRLSSAPHVIVLYMLPSTPTNQWCCSYCFETEIQLVSNCEHTKVVIHCLEQICSKFTCTMEYLFDLLTRSAAFHHIPNLTTACFYGESRDIQLAVVRSGLNKLSMPIDNLNRIHVVRRFRKTGTWRCVAVSCMGVAAQSDEACEHSNVVYAHLREGITSPFSSLFRLQGSQVRGLDRYGRQEETEIIPPRHARSMIPSERAFQVDMEVNQDARNGSTRTVRSASSCHCGCRVTDLDSTSIAKIPLRIETLRCHVNYLQEVWTCGRGHHVISEESEEQRTGLVWISRHTAFTEVFLFDMLMQMILGGTTISSQADIRSQIMHLQTLYTTRQEAPRSHHSVRKALIIYAMAVVKGLQDWVFRCQKCAIPTTNGVYYDKLSFDGQQIGFNVTKDVRYDFYGKKATAWCKPVERCPTAWQKVHRIESHALRSLITEALRVRGVPPGCDSVSSLCRLMMNVPLQSKETVRAAVAAIKLFDPSWKSFVFNVEDYEDDTNFETFQQSYNGDLGCHPAQLVCKELTAQSFNTTKQISDLFVYVIDAGKAAAIISVMLVNLREDLKQHIPTLDAGFLNSYASWYEVMLNEWLLNMSETDNWALIVPSVTFQDLEHSMPAGIAEHEHILRHPYRPPWSWTRNEDVESPSTTFANACNMICTIREVGNFHCPEQAVKRAMLMVMALLNEPVSVWLRDGTFGQFNAACDVLISVEQFEGSPNTSPQCREAMSRLQQCVILYEGIMGIVGINHAAMHSALRNFLLCIPEKFNAYKAVMDEFSARDTNAFSPKQFDDMLSWTGAVEQSMDDNETGAVSADFMREKYRNLAALQSCDFLETGVWAPDFPVRRPSPSSSVWGTDPVRGERSCSKDFNVHNAFSPGTFGGYCLCTHVKTVLVMFLKQPEGCRMPLNFIIERCAKLPRYVVYDFACGTQKAAIGFLRKVVETSSFIIDPFHFKGHKTCSLAMHESSYSDVRGQNTESQEQINDAIRLMERTLRACRDVHFMHFVVLAHGYHNLKSMFRDCNDVDPTEWGTRAWIRWVRDNLFPS